jgi:hypothetical protein
MVFSGFRFLVVEGLKLVFWFKNQKKNVLVQVPDNFGEILSHPKNNFTRSGHIYSVRSSTTKLTIFFHLRVVTTSKLTIFFHLRIVTTSKLTFFFHPRVVTTSKLTIFFHPRVVTTSKLTIVFHPRVVTTSKLTIFFHPLVVTTSGHHLV